MTRKKQPVGVVVVRPPAWLYICRLLLTALIFSVLCVTRRRSTTCLGCDPLMAAFRRDPLKKSLLGSFQFLDRSGAQLAMWRCCFQSWQDTILGVRSPSSRTPEHSSSL